MFARTSTSPSGNGRPWEVLFASGQASWRVSRARVVVLRVLPGAWSQVVYLNVANLRTRIPKLTYCTTQHTLIVRQIRPFVENEESFRKFGHGGCSYNSILGTTTVTDF